MKKFISIISGMILLGLTACSEKMNEKSTSEEQFCNYRYALMNDGYMFWNNEGGPSYLDYETMEITMFCNIPNCTHSASPCISYILNESHQFPIIYNKCAYYFINTNSFGEKDGKSVLNLNTVFMKYDFEQMEVSEVVEINDYNTNGDGYLIGSEYYFTTNYGNPKYDDSGNVWSSSNNGGGNLFSINLESNEVNDYGEIFDYEALKKDFPAAATSTDFVIRGKNNEELYLSVIYQKESPSREFLEQGIGTPPSFYGDTYTFNLDTNKVEKINSYRSIHTMNGYFAYCDGDNSNILLVQDLDTNEVIQMADYSGSSDIMIHNDKVWEESMCFDIKTGQKKRFTDLNFAKVIDVYEENYIIKGEDSDGNIVFEKIPCEEIDSLFE